MKTYNAKKYTNFIKPIFKEKRLRRKSEPGTSGTGVFLSSDLNAHFQRLELLLASQMAGNTGG